MLRVLPNNTPDGVNKNLRLTQALAKQDLEFFLCDEDVKLIFYLPLVLLPVKQSGIFKENGGKWHPILIFSPGSGKMVFTLLEEVIALQLSFISIHVQEPGL